MLLAGNCAIESMGGKTFGFGGGRPDVWEPEEDVFWGPETVWLDDKRYSGERELANPLGAVQMGLIYVNPEGPNGNPDPVASGHDVRETFARMAMNDEETVALVAGGHTFGKGHGAGPEDSVAAEPEGAPIEQQGLGWTNSFESGMGVHTTTSGFEGAWTPNPIAWDNGYFDVLFGYEWEKVMTPAGHVVWHAIDLKDDDHAPEVDGSGKKVPIMMTTADMSMRMDPAYEKISRRFHENPDQFADAFARAWYKLLHRDMGPVVNLHGPEVPSEELVWQDPVPAGNADLSAADIADLKSQILGSGLSNGALVRVAWASAASYRGSDMRGGANGARVRLAPQKDWAANNPAELSDVLAKLEGIQSGFGKSVSLADLIVLGGSAAVEQAAKNAGHSVEVAFAPGRGDASADQTDADSFDVLEPTADGFRNYYDHAVGSPADMLVDKAQLLGLTAPEMTALVGGLRVIGGNTGGSTAGVFTDKIDTLSNDFFVNLLDMSTKWTKSGDYDFEGCDRSSGDVKWTATEVDLVFGSNSVLRALAEVYASNDGAGKLAADFAAAWTKVMNNDRFDLA